MSAGNIRHDIFDNHDIISADLVAQDLTAAKLQQILELTIWMRQQLADMMTPMLGIKREAPWHEESDNETEDEESQRSSKRSKPVVKVKVEEKDDDETSHDDRAAEVVVDTCDTSPAAETIAE